MNSPGSPFFEELLDHHGIAAEGDVPGQPMNADLAAWLPLASRSLSELVGLLRMKGASRGSVLATMRTLQRWHEEYGYVEIARLLGEFSGLQAPTPYDAVHEHAGYEFSSATRPSTFARWLIEKEIIRGRTVLDVGCGNGRDVIAYAEAGAREAIGIDSSPFIVERFNDRIAGLDPAIRSRIVATCSSVDDMLTVHFAHRDRADLVTWNSVLHLLPRRRLAAILRNLATNILSDTGLVAASIKTPNSFFNRTGFLVEAWDGGNSRMCSDGQCRWFETADTFVESLRYEFGRVLETRLRTSQRPDGAIDERIDVIAEKGMENQASHFPKTV